MTSPPATPLHSRRRAPRLGSAAPIKEAATTLFLRNGYLGTSVDDIAALAHVSKQTVYTHFADKEQLFAEIIRANFGRADEFIQALSAGLVDAADVETSLKKLARRYITTVVQPDAVRLRRLVIAEAGRFPDLARSYHEQVPRRVTQALAEQFQQLVQHRVLRLDNAVLAANQFAWLVLGAAIDEAMFYADAKTPSWAELERQADAAVDVFLAAYSTSSIGRTG